MGLFSVSLKLKTSALDIAEVLKVVCVFTLRNRCLLSLVKVVDFLYDVQ